MEFSYLQVLILFSLCHIIEILQVLQKVEGNIMTYLNQSDGIQEFNVYLMVLRPLLLLCAVILFLPKSSM